MKADPAQVSALIDIVEGTHEYPKLKGLHDSAMFDLEELSTEEEEALAEEKAKKQKAKEEKAAKEKEKAEAEAKNNKGGVDAKR